ncbi:hypothetical protein DJ484_17785 [Escherichia coli]|nr:hypothetical protein [Escherichia coli]EEY3854606.1 hypothetical protein [Escherichia coli]EEY4031109.1 hypothetical protein [Escherichia coli]EFC6803286.1 hypothetical protein [Escherichia coli]EFE9091111.1 hypothetical protein [Escherichia coli]
MIILNGTPIRKHSFLLRIHIIILHFITYRNTPKKSLYSDYMFFFNELDSVCKQKHVSHAVHT